MLQLYNPGPVTNRWAAGVLVTGAVAAKQQHFSCHTHAAAAASVLVLLCTCCNSLQPTSALLLIEGLRGCCTMVLQLLLQVLSSSIAAAALALHLLQPSWCSCTFAAAYVLQLAATSPCPVTILGAKGGLLQLPVGRRVAPVAAFVLQLSAAYPLLLRRTVAPLSYCLCRVVCLVSRASLCVRRVSRACGALGCCLWGGGGGCVPHLPLVPQATPTGYSPGGTTPQGEPQLWATQLRHREYGGGTAGGGGGGCVPVARPCCSAGALLCIPRLVRCL